MTEHPEPLPQALEEHDISLALTPGQLLLLALGVFLIVRLIRSRR